MKTIFLSLIFSILCCLIIGNSSRAEEFVIKHADSLKADKEKINVEGNIVINYKNAIIEAQEGLVETNNNGKPYKAIFTGRPKFKLKDRKIVADKITILIEDKIIIAEGKTESLLKGKNNNPIFIVCDYQELHWNGEDANAKGNLKTTYEDTTVKSEEAKIIYKNKRPNQAIFLSYVKPANLEQPTNITSAMEFIFDIHTKNVQATGNVQSTIWTDQKKERVKQEPILLTADNLFIDHSTGSVVAIAQEREKVKLSYEETKGESFEAFLTNKGDGTPEKIIFKGNANVTQLDKQITSEEVVFNFKDKKLTGNTQTNIRPKTLIFKNK